MKYLLFTSPINIIYCCKKISSSWLFSLNAAVKLTRCLLFGTTPITRRTGFVSLLGPRLKDVLGCSSLWTTCSTLLWSLLYSSGMYIASTGSEIFSSISAYLTDYLQRFRLCIVSSCQTNSYFFSTIFIARYGETLPTRLRFVNLE